LGYKYSGYDRGHLVPAADMSWNDTAMAESFYFSNISPQLPGFNRGIWKTLENKVRTWAKTYDCLYIATGAVCQHPAKSIGENSITIPTHFYKTVLIYNDTIRQGIGFIMPHANSKKDVFDYAVSIDSVEKMTNLNFYHKLPNRKERKIESAYDKTFWKSNVQ
jgi:endonuclease G, mitochondrial